MNRAVIFDLYETLITENHPEWHAERPPHERWGLTQEGFDRERASGYQPHRCQFRDFSQHFMVSVYTGAAATEKPCSFLFPYSTQISPRWG